MGVELPCQRLLAGGAAEHPGRLRGGVTGLMGCEQLVKEPMRAGDAASGV